MAAAVYTDTPRGAGGERDEYRERERMIRKRGSGQ